MLDAPFFLRFWLMLEIASPWIGSELIVFDVIFPVIGLPLMSLLVLVFKIWLLVIWLLCFHSSRTVPRFVGFVLSPFPLCSLILLQLSSLVASLVALPFAMFATPGLDSVFLRICFMGLESCFCFQSWALISCWLTYIFHPSSCFSSSHASLGIRVRSYSLGALAPSIQSFAVLRWHGRLVCACLICKVLLIS